MRNGVGAVSIGESPRRPCALARVLLDWQMATALSALREGPDP
jgi:hypothetical protein